MLESLRYNLARLFAFSGRSSRAQFWPFASLLLGLFMIEALVAAPFVLNEILSRARDVVARNPEDVQVAVGPGSVQFEFHGAHPELMPSFEHFLDLAGLSGAILVLLFATATVRRLHDRDRTGFWAAPPLVFGVAGFLGTRWLFAHVGPEAFDPAVFLLLLFNNLFYFGSLLWLAIQLAARGTPGPNRYGDPPA